MQTGEGSFKDTLKNAQAKVKSTLGTIKNKASDVAYSATNLHRKIGDSNLVNIQLDSAASHLFDDHEKKGIKDCKVVVTKESGKIIRHAINEHIKKATKFYFSRKTNINKLEEKYEKGEHKNSLAVQKTILADENDKKHYNAFLSELNKHIVLDLMCHVILEKQSSTKIKSGAHDDLVQTGKIIQLKPVDKTIIIRLDNASHKNDVTTIGIDNLCVGGRKFDVHEEKKHVVTNEKSAAEDINDKTGEVCVMKKVCTPVDNNTVDDTTFDDTPVNDNTKAKTGGGRRKTHMK